jgi:hypothetical protein
MLAGDWLDLMRGLSGRVVTLTSVRAGQEFVCGIWFKERKMVSQIVRGQVLGRGSQLAVFGCIIEFTVGLCSRGVSLSISQGMTDYSLYWQSLLN